MLKLLYVFFFSSFLRIMHDTFDFVIKNLLLLYYSSYVAALLSIWLRHYLSLYRKDMYYIGEDGAGKVVPTYHGLVRWDDLRDRDSGAVGRSYSYRSAIATPISRKGLSIRAFVLLRLYFGEKQQSDPKHAFHGRKGLKRVRSFTMTSNISHSNSSARLIGSI